MIVRTAVNHAQPTTWVRRRLSALPADGVILDLACGSGRNTRVMLNNGLCVRGVDRNLTGIDDLRNHSMLELQQYDLEAEPWPYASECFAAIVVTNYLHRPLFPALADSLTTGGYLIYETFAHGNEAYGRPRNPEFLLRKNELQAVFRPLLSVLQFEQTLEKLPRPAVRQRLLAQKNPRG